MKALYFIFQLRNRALEEHKKGVPQFFFHFIKITLTAVDFILENIKLEKIHMRKRNSIFSHSCHN